jgi:hypothetical protein
MEALNQDLNNRVDVLRSMRFICTCIVILFHRAATLGASPLWNLEFLEKVSESVMRNDELFFSIDKCLDVTIKIKPC